ncbi:IclR family transcriptional regulator [Bordetella genomosp. 4]|uniref:IclR family transcriptional regulator n=1 Tax=Bordetella genomosp. 4 TaxID=463044 RepID=A0A261UTI2_9BORD|nr:IclR family transcriptional regulator [Bordetella genomosp. 4]OZI53376.1 IclR family transcriptional regulator [Bordetella genomosp. 4]OZI64857.1 IclR family transcriptional regulator [Bordetella genomosp. 4]
MPASTPVASPPTAQVAGTAAFSKFMHILQLVADTSDPMTIAELSKLSGYPRPTVYRTVAALLAERLLAEHPHTGKLTLGPRLIQLASRSWGRSELRLAAVEALKQLRDVTGETVHLAVPNGQHMVYIEKLESPSAVQMNSRIGTNVSLHSTAVGKAYLAMLDRESQQAVLETLPQPLPHYMPNTVKDLKALRGVLEQVRQRGWSVDDEENEAGIYCFGAPIFGRNGMPVAAISVSTLRFRQKPDPETAYVAPLLQACRAISQRLAETPALSSADML